MQRPVYFISEVLSDSKTHYTQIQKLLYALLIAMRKLRPVMVMMSFPLDKVFQNRNATGKIAKWALKLMGQGISYASRMAMKS